MSDIREARQSAGAEWERTRLIGALIEVLFRLAESEPTILVLEDVHWADGETAQVVAVLARRLQRQRLGVLLTAREDERAWVAGREWLLELERLPAVVDLPVGRLPRAEVEALLNALVGGPVEESTAEWVAALSEGNPYAVVELARAVRAGTRALPASLAELLLARLHGIGPAGRLLAELLATARRPVPEPVLTAAAAMGELGEDATAAGLRGLLERHAAVAVGEDRFVLRHALLAEALAAGMLPSQRERRHEHLAQALEAGTDAPAAEIAGHWSAARRWPEALRWTLRAADAAAAVYGYAASAAHLEHAAELWQHVPDAQTLTGTTRWHLLQEAADRWQYVHPAECDRIAAAAVDRIRQAGPPDGALLLALHAQALLYRGRDPAAAVGAARDAAQLATSAPPDIRAAVGAKVGWVLLGAGMVSDALRVTTSACPTEPAPAPLLAARGAAKVRTGDVEGGVQDAEHALSTANDPATKTRVAAGATDTLMRLNRLTRVVDIGRPLVVELRTAGMTDSGVSALHSNVATALVELGRLEEAIEALGPEIELLAGGEPRLAQVVYARLQRLRGDVQGSARVIEGLRGRFGYHIPDVDVPLSVAEAEAALLAGRPEDVQPLLASCVARNAGRGEDWQLAEVGWLATRSCAEVAVAARRADKLQQAARAVETLEEVVTSLPEDARHSGESGCGAVVRGFEAAREAEAVRARGQEASRAWRRAVERWRELERPLHELYANLRLAESLAALGATDQAETIVNASYAAATTMRLRPLRDELAAVARRYRLHLPSADTPDGPLSARELEVLALVAAGHSNQQIGIELYLSPSTVRVHLSNILRKLNVTTRAEAAATAYRRALIT